LCYNPANLKFGVISINKLSAGIFSPIYVTFEIVGQNIDFVGYYLIRDAFINKARRYEQGTVYERMAVHPLDFVKIKLAFPSLAEQEKIANFLTSIVKAIELREKQIAQAVQWKKGLMQQMFV
jgi:type I restriction enzyme S subunit